MGVANKLWGISFYRGKCMFWSTCIEAVRDVCSVSSQKWQSFPFPLNLHPWWTVHWLIAIHIRVPFSQKTRLDRLIDSGISIWLIAALSINRLIGRIVTALVRGTILDNAHQFFHSRAVFFCSRACHPLFFSFVSIAGYTSKITS